MFRSNSQILPSTFAVLLAAVLLAFVATAPASAAVSSEQAVEFLNQQRAANGIPGDLTNVPEWADGCAKHNRYMHETGNFGHDEQPGPFYTEEGAEAGAAAVLATGSGYDTTGENPWEWAPIHLYIMLDPRRKYAGYSGSYGYACMRFYGREERFLPAEADFGDIEFYSYPGPGTSGIYPTEIAGEQPYIPQELVGIPAGQATGPNILLFSLNNISDYFYLSASSYSLTGPDGPIQARLVTETTSNEVGSGFWFQGGGVLIPEQPLDEFTTYKVSIKWQPEWYIEPDMDLGHISDVADRTYPQEFEFTTGAEKIEPTEEIESGTPRGNTRKRSRGLYFKYAGRRGRRLRLRLIVNPVLVGQQATLSVQRLRWKCRRARRGRAQAQRHRSPRCKWAVAGRGRVNRRRLRRSQGITMRMPRGRGQKVVAYANTNRVRLKSRVLTGQVRKEIRGKRRGSRAKKRRGATLQQMGPLLGPWAGSREAVSIRKALDFQGFPPTAGA